MNSTGSFPVLSFRLGSQDYALFIEDVIEVASMVELMTVPGTRSEILGMVNRHGVMLPLLDLRAVFQQTVTPINSATLFIVTQSQGRNAGLVVDEIYQVEHVALEKLHNIPMRGKYIQSAVSHKDHLMQIIALSTLFADFLSQSIVSQ